MTKARDLAEIISGGGLAVTGDLSTTGAFTSQGIDDNADANAITIDSSEKVGIGTTSPSTLLHVRGTDGVSALTVGNTTENTALAIRTAQDDRVVLRSEDGGTARALAFETGTSEHMRIDSAGDIGIGTTSQVNGGKVSIATSAESAILSLLSRSTTDSDEPFIVLQKSSTDSGNFAATADGEALGSIKFRGVNTSAVSDIGAEINVVQNGTSSSTVPTDIKIRTNEAERMVIKSTTGLIKYNGAFVYYFRGSVNNNASISIDIPDISSAGATQVHAFYTHHAIQNYGAAIVSTLGMYIGGIVSTHNIQNISSSGGGSWSYSSPGNNVLRITKNAGTYIGGGHYVVKVETFNGPS
tara:strand:- start:6838 stop:7902 length:1065 start_codon:yes stop_codon:yes gene_type:complete